MHILLITYSRDNTTHCEIYDSEALAIRRYAACIRDLNVSVVKFLDTKERATYNRLEARYVSPYWLGEQSDVSNNL